MHKEFFYMLKLLLILDDLQLTLLFTQIQVISKKNHPLYLTPIKSHMDLRGPVVQDNKVIN